MKGVKMMRALVVALGVIIIVLLAILIFAPVKKSASGPPVPVVVAPLVSSDGHLSVTAPSVNEVIASPVTVAGTVSNGGWFFEASFPVKVLDGDGTVIGQGIAQAQGDWMTNDPVLFTATVSFAAPHAATGTIVLSKDNPSGDPKKDLSLRIPVRFK